jgi:hypothetical protein
MDSNYINIDGTLKKYEDIIFTSSETHFSFIDRIKILFGKKCIVKTQIYTKHETIVLFTESQTIIN